MNCCHSLYLDTVCRSSIILPLATTGCWLHHHLERHRNHPTVNSTAGYSSFFLPHHWQHCLAVVTQVNTQNRNFPLFGNLHRALHPFLGAHLQEGPAGLQWHVPFKRVLAPTLHDPQESLSSLDTMKPPELQNEMEAFRHHSS